MQDLESMQTALKFANTFGRPPYSFTEAIRFLLIDHQQGSKTFSKKSEFQVSRLLKSPTFLACVYFAAKTFHPDQIETGQRVSDMDMARTFGPFDFACIIALIFLYKRAKRLCKEEEWPYIAEPLQANLEIAAHFGKAMPNVGFGVGLLAGSMVNVAHSTFAAYHMKTFQKYRRVIKNRNIVFDKNMENKNWGCAAYQIVPAILVSTGLGKKMAEAFYNAYDLEAGEEGKLSVDGRRFYYARRWLEDIKKRPTMPKFIKNDPERPEDTRLDMLLEQANRLLEQGSTHQWLAKNKEDLSAETTPELFATPEASVVAGDEELSEEFKPKCTYDDLPEEVRNQLPPEEFEQIKHLTVEEIVSLFA